MTGLSANGFLSKRFPEIKAELEELFRAEFGADINLSAETVFGQLIGVESEAIAEYWAQLEDVYLSQYPNTAQGVALDLLVAINGITRLPALPTTATGYLTLDIGTTVPAGSKAKDGQSTYTLLDAVTASASTAHGATVSVATVADTTDYTITVDATPYTHTSGAGATEGSILTGLQSALPIGFTRTIENNALVIGYEGPLAISVTANLSIDSVQNIGQFSADDTGPQSLPVGGLSEIETPIVGWQSVTNREAGTTGRSIESDGDLRVRRALATSSRAVSTVDGITSELLQTAGVTGASVLENTTDTTDANGIPPAHIWCIVDGGSGADIAGVIFRRKAAGIGTFGTESAIQVSEISGTSYTFNYDRPNIIPAYITINISASPSLPTNYAELVRNAVVAYGATLGIGQDLILNRIPTIAGRAIDAQSFIDSVTIGTAPSPTGTANLIAAADDRFQIIAGNIDVLLA